MTGMVWRDPQPLVLASGSRTRAAMLESVGIPVEMRAAALDERSIEADLLADGATPSVIALALARAKALSVSRALSARLVLGADQTLHCGGQAVHKPVDRQAAKAQLLAMSGQTHILHAAAALACNGVVLAETGSKARLTMRVLEPDAIERYCDLAGPAILESVGAYQLEALGVHLFETIEGDYFTILGLPLLGVLAALRQSGKLSL